MTVITGINGNPCVICYQDILETDDAMRCTNERMLHIFHTACVTNWASTRPLGEQVPCLLCMVDHFLPIQGSRTQNESAEELELAQRAQELRQQIQEQDQQIQELQQQIQEEQQQIQEERQRNQEREAENRSIKIGIIAGTALCLTRDINLTKATSIGIALILTARILPKLLNKMGTRSAVSIAVKGIVGGTAIGFCITSVALMAIKLHKIY